jgi:GNAT superfamily N-acetyltransferase
MNKHLPSSGLIIRPASFTDVPFIRAIADKTWPASYEALLGKEQVEYMLDKLYNPLVLEDQIKKQHYFFLALKEYQHVGFCSFSNVEKDVYKLQKLYVLPSEQKTGLGKALLETVETVSKSMGAKKLQLNVNRKNIAKQFYERNGFIVIKEEDIDIGHGYFMNDYVMEKDL